MSEADDDRPRILIAGGGVAALEACLALRAFLPEEDLAIDIVSPAPRFEYRPLAVLEPFDGDAVWGMDLERFASDQDAGLLADGLASVEPSERVAITAAGRRLSYTLLLVAAGAEPVRAVPGALTFRGSRDATPLRDAIDAAGDAIAFVVPPGAFWSLPLYELAILSAARLRARERDTAVLVVTHETSPVEAFGAQASAAVRDLLDAHGVRFHGGVSPVAADAGDLELADGQRLAAGTVVSLPHLRGRRIEGLAHDAAGFVRVDEHCRVPGCEGVFAAGDITDFPLKQGGLAAQQADAAAEAMLAEIGLPIVPRPFKPVLQGVLYTGSNPTYLRGPVAGHAPAPRSYSMWWPPSKIAGHYLSPYLTIRAGAPRAPEVRPDAAAEVEVVPVSIDVARAVQSVRGVIAGDTVPPG
ncbi:MAG: FAD-dependent oxidoreductase [Solirubrobacteraceae bacterium]